MTMARIIHHPTVDVALTEQEARMALVSVREIPPSETTVALDRKFSAALTEFQRRIDERQKFLDSLTDEDIELIRTARANQGRTDK